MAFLTDNAKNDCEYICSAYGLDVLEFGRRDHNYRVKEPKALGAWRDCGLCSCTGYWGNIFLW